jgi:hypothetical protein
MRFLQVALGLVLFASAAAADEAPLAAGARVRVTLLARQDAPVVGTLLAYRPESLTLAAEPDSAESTFARAAVGKLERSAGTYNNAGKGALYGALLGGASGFLLGTLFESAVKEGDTEGIAVAVGAGGVVLGGLIGAVVGGGSRHERWETVQ